MEGHFAGQCKDFDKIRGQWRDRRGSVKALRHERELSYLSWCCRPDLNRHAFYSGGF